MNNYFSHIECVNLRRRGDKWNECLLEFDKYGIVVERFDAIEGNPIGYKGRLPDGAIGNLLSHIEIIKKAKANGHDSVLIFEDDIELIDGFDKLFTEYIKEVPEDWDLLYLGGNHNNQPTVMVNPHVRRITDTYTTHAYAIRNTVYDLVLTRLSDFSAEGDVLMADIQKECRAYCISPNIATQRAGVSDVFNKYVDYDFLRNRDGNTRG